MLTLPLSLLGNTRASALIDARGTIVWATLPDSRALPLFDTLDDHAGGRFRLEPDGPYQIERRYLGESPILQTLFETPGGKASVLDFMPLRPGPVGDFGRARLPHDRLVRIVEVHEGELDFRLDFAPWLDGAPGALQQDPNGVIASGPRTSLLFQSEAEVVLHPHGLTGRMRLKKGEKRHFVLTHVADPDPDVPEMRANEPAWDLDGSIDYWLAWGRLCPFQGVQRAHVLHLLALLKACGSPRAGAPHLDGPYAMLACVALAAWGYEDAIELIAAWQPEHGSAADRERAGWLLWGLEAAQEAGLVEATLVVPHWPVLRGMLDAIAQAHPEGPAARAAAWAGLGAGLALADALLLEGDAAAWESAREALQTTLTQDPLPVAMRVALGLGADAPPSEEDAIAHGDAPGAIWRVRRELATGGYLQARRLMDQLLVAYEPLGLLPTQPQPALGELALATWTAAQIYLQSAPTPSRVELPGDLGE